MITSQSPTLKSYDDGPWFFRLIDLSFLTFWLVTTTIFLEINFSKDYWFILTANILLFIFFSELFQLYKKLRLGKFSERVLVLLVTLVLTFMALAVLLFLLKASDAFSRLAIFWWFLLTLFSLISWRVIYRKIRGKFFANGVNLRKAAIIGYTGTGKSLKRQIIDFPELGIDFVGFYDDREHIRLGGTSPDIKGGVDQALEQAQKGQIDSIYICLPITAELRISHIIHQLGDSTANVFMVPDFLISSLMHGNISSIGNVDTISVFETPFASGQEILKRGFDIIFSLIVIMLISPILIVIALLVKLTSKGPVIFKQDRHGLDGKKIKVYKFRSMSVMENSNKVTQVQKGDKRITPIGNFLRKTSLDELPQFFNVIKGDMSVVGPRPHAVAHNEEYRKQVDYYMLRHKVRPGITGWAQINGWRGETDTLDKMEKRIEYDLQYIRNWSLWWDIKIIFMTIFKGFVNKNAY